MAIVDVFTTHVGLILRWEQTGKEGEVVLDNVFDPTTPAKRLYPKAGVIYTQAGAKACFEEIKEHYEERAKAEA